MSKKLQRLKARQEAKVPKVIIHQMDQELVQKTIDAKIQIYEDHKLKDKNEHLKILERYKEDQKKGEAKRLRVPPKSAKKENINIDKTYDEYIQYEKEHYGLVRIVEDPSKGKKRFFLVYGINKDHELGTGGFDSIEQAANWFLKQGR
jgi:hypothetical protein